MMNGPQCPKCGGTQSSQLAPGLFVCQQPVQKGVHGGQPVIMRCGNRFQVGTGTANVGLCSCGVMAIGECQSCMRRVCGHHATLGERTLCPSCSARDSRLKEMAHEDRLQSSIDSHKRIRAAALAAQRPQVIQAALKHSNETERLLLAARHWLPDRVFLDRGFTYGQISDTIPEAFSDAFPMLWPSVAVVDVDPVEPPWDCDIVARFFLERAVNQQIKPAWRGNRSLITWKRPHGWYIESTRVDGGSMTGSRVGGGRCHVLVREGGERLSAPGEPFSFYGLRQMAEILELSDPEMQIHDQYDPWAKWRSR
jgi:hypothetical protein